jgi:3-dehydroquinate synthase class II
VRGQLALKEFAVTEIADAGTGDRVCVDTCSNFFLDEGLLVGAFGGGFLLCCSETHPLPYMPTRPFRVNAGAVSSYILSSPERTNYLSELRQGHTVTAVRVNGDTGPVVVGRPRSKRVRCSWSRRAAPTATKRPSCCNMIGTSACSGARARCTTSRN